jgi:hypothetical protein
MGLFTQPCVCRHVDDNIVALFDVLDASVVCRTTFCVNFHHISVFSSAVRFWVDVSGSTWATHALTPISWWIGRYPSTFGGLYTQ